MAIGPIKLVAGGVGLFTLLMVFAIQRIPVPETAAAAERRFDDAWQDTIRVIPLKKADRLRMASTEPKVTERITPPAPDAPASVPPVILVQDDDKPPASRHRRHSRPESNVCTRHHMHRVAIRGGKSWRCRK